jgi:predicted TIM-barrel fold metal-dependent hydrolase
MPGHAWDSPPGRVLALMDAAGIERGVIMPYVEIDRNGAAQLELGARHAAEHPGRFLLFARLHPGARDASELLEHAVRDLGYVGLKLHPVGSEVAPADELTVRLVRTAAALGVPTLFHCGDEPLTLPADIGPLAERVPEAAILLGHAGGYFHVAQAVEWAQRCPNLYLETSATPDLTGLRRALDTLGPSRLIFGSDGPGCLPALEVHKLRLLLRGHAASAADLARDNLRRLLPLPEGA